MRLACWNVNGLKNNLRNDDFKKCIDKYDFVAIVETHHTKQSNINIRGFKHYDIAATKFKTKGRHSGGIAFYFKKQYTNSLTYIKSASNYILWVRLCKQFYTNLHNDIYIAVTYARPNTFRPDNNFYTTLENEIIKHSAKGKVILLGDLNARIGEGDDFSIDQITDNIPLPITYSFDTASPRQNQDTTINACGRQLLELCKMSGMRILNGRTAGDSLGCVTCYRAAGKSTVDYIIVDQTLLQHIDYFRVDTITDMSDHCLIETRLSLTLKENTDSNDNTYTLNPHWSKFVWSTASPDSFRAALLDQDIQDKHAAFLTTSFQNNKLATNRAVDDFVNIMQLAGTKALQLRTFRTKPKPKSNTKKNGWFNSQCYTQKSELNLLSRKLKNNPFDRQLHELYFIKRKEYKKTLKNQKRTYKNELLNQLTTLQSNDPKQFWSLLDKLKNPDTEISKCTENIHPKEWYEHFSSLAKKSHRHECDSLQLKCIQLENQTQNPAFEALNAPVTISEIKTVIKSLKNNKSTGPDMISYEMIKHGQYVLLPALAKLFYLVLNSKCFPENWNISAITPLHKKGSLFDPDNYRGISITSCLGKCFTSVLANRLLSCIETNSIMPDNQAAFRKTFRTTDHIYTLQSIINKYCLKQRGKLYTCFVDFKKAFDSVWREGMLYKLLKIGIGGKFYQLMKHMYETSTSCVKLSSGLSPEFNMELGIKQGDCLSPLLFNLFINDIGDIFSSTSDPVKLGDIDLSYLLYADDLLLLSTSREGLQHNLNKLNCYAKKWHLDINIKKTNAVIFQKYGKKVKPTFELGETRIDTCKTYSYLGITFDQNCNFKTATDDLKTKASKAQFSLFSALSSSDVLDVNIYTKLFDSLIKPIATYGCEVWLPNQIKKITLSNISKIDTLPFEKLHNTFCKRTLGIYRSISNVLARLELGRLPLLFSTATQVIKYWSYIMSKPKQSILYNAYHTEYENDSNWVIIVKNLLFICGCQNQWDNQTPLDLKVDLPIIKRKLKHVLLNLYKNSPCQIPELLTEYNYIDDEIHPQPYLLSKVPRYLKISISRLRLQSNRLEIVRGRYNRPKVPKEQRLCSSCKLIDDEVHLLTNCTLINNLRNTTFKTISDDKDSFIALSDRDKAHTLLHPCTYEETLAFGHFIYKAFQQRNL